jgi:non-ribosomal peptide synthetase component E (peptide arylation enzyme)
MHLALNRIGALLLPIHDRWGETEVAHLLGRGRAVAAITPYRYRGVDYPEMYAAFRAGLPSLRTHFTLDGGGGGSEAFEPLLQRSTVEESVLQTRRPSPDERAHIMVSSGTTALPKISVFTSNNLLALLDSFCSHMKIVPEDVAAALAPMGTGATGYAFPVLAPLIAGASCVLLEHWHDPADAVDLIIANRCTFATAIPTQKVQMLPDLERRSPEDFASFTRFNNAGAPLPYETGKKIEKLMGCRIQVVYGSTDGGVPCITSIDDPQDKRLRTVGRRLELREVELWDAEGRQVQAGEAGEVVWRSPDKSFGYLNDPEAVRATFTSDGFYRSGDLGHFDEDGYLSIVGRVKDMILRGGRNISPRLIEETLTRHAAVLEVAVAAMPDPVMGERACAFIVLSERATLTFEEVIAFLKEEKISAWQLPERLEILAELPKSAGMKVEKRKLTEMVAEKLKAEAAGKVSA